MTTGTVSAAAPTAPPASQTQPSKPAADQSVTDASAVNGQIDKTTFLKLLVAQLRNQNPLSPADGTEFISQLAGFSQLEQSISMAQDLSAIRKVLEASHPDTGASPTPGAAATPGATSGTTAAPPPAAAAQP